ncbi:hypothetical protein [Streptomyces sp. NPDC006996]|uniref:hypothetical protein n=1 Tax=Streptomyces sp. NPDC006996 TaxID=3156908 RepID=UPI0033FE1723
MDLEKSSEPARGEGCLAVAIRIPVRIVVLVLVVPVRMVRDALVVGGRFLNDTVFRPVGRALLWVGRAVFVWPFVGLWRYVLVPLGRAAAWLGKVLVVLPAMAFHRYVLTPLGHVAVWVYAYVLTPVGRALAAAGAGVWAGLAWLGRYLVVVPSGWVYRWILTPVGHAAVWCGRGLAWCGRGLLWLLTMIVTGVATALYWTARVLLVLPALAVWRWVLAPVGRVLAVVAREIGAAFGHAWRIAGHVSLAVGRFLAALFRWTFVEPVRWVYRGVLTPVGHLVRDAVLRPAAEAGRRVGRATRQALGSVRTTVRRTRADVRRALFGEPEGLDLAGSRGTTPGRGVRNVGDGQDVLTKG